MNGPDHEAVRATCRAAFVLAFFCFAAGAQPGHAQGLVVSPVSLVGKWSGSETTPNGSTVTVELVLMQNLKFSGSSAIDGKIFWTYSGTWEVNGDKLTWHYEASSRPLPESAKADTDDIVALDAEKLILLSRLSGKKNAFRRIR